MANPGQAILRPLIEVFKPLNDRAGARARGRMWSDRVAGGLLVALYTLSDFGAVSILRFDSLTRIIYVQYTSALDRGSAAALALLLVALARTLAAEPDLILLDEPFSNLDPGLRGRVRAEVRQIIESLGTTAVFVTHDQEEALSLAAEVAVMLGGRVQQVGRPQDVYMRPASRGVAEFLGDANFLPGDQRNGVVQCELGRLPAPAGPEGAVDVMVRPESMVLTEAGGQPVEVLGMEYYSHDQMVTVRLPSGAPLKVRLLPSQDFQRGQRLGLKLAGSVVVFPRRR